MHPVTRNGVEEVLNVDFEEQSVLQMLMKRGNVAARAEVIKIVGKVNAPFNEVYDLSSAPVVCCARYENDPGEPEVWGASLLELQKAQKDGITIMGDGLFNDRYSVKPFQSWDGSGNRA